jgi:hypothetical protein
VTGDRRQEVIYKLVWLHSQFIFQTPSLPLAGHHPCLLTQELKASELGQCSSLATQAEGGMLTGHAPWKTVERDRQYWSYVLSLSSDSATHWFRDTIQCLSFFIGKTEILIANLTGIL